DWSSDVCSSDLSRPIRVRVRAANALASRSAARRRLRLMAPATLANPQVQANSGPVTSHDQMEFCARAYVTHPPPASQPPTRVQMAPVLSGSSRPAPEMPDPRAPTTDAPRAQT